MKARHAAAPLAHPLWTPGVLTMVALMVPGLFFIAASVCRRPCGRDEPQPVVPLGHLGGH